MFVVFSVVTAVVSLVVTWIAWQYRDTEGVYELVVFNIGILIWTGGNALQRAVVTESAKIFTINVQYIGIALVPIGIFAFAAQFAGHKRWARGPRLAAVVAPFAVLVVLTWTNHWHHLVRTENVQVVEEAGLVVDSFMELDRSAAWGPGFWVGWVYSQGLLVFSTGMLLWRVLDARDIFQYQAAAIVLGSLVPWAGHFVYLLGLSPFEPEVFFVFSGAAFVYAVLRYQLLDLVPVARDTVFELMEDGVIVVDPEDRIVDVNRAVLTVLARDQSELVGEDIDTALEDLPDLLEFYDKRESSEDLAIESGGDTRYYAVQLSEYTFESAWEESGVVMVLHDITPIRDREQELERQNEQLEVVADTISHDLRNPLNVAAGFLQQARQQGDEDAFDRVERSHDRMKAIIEDVLTLARHNNDIEPEPVSVASVAHEAWDHVDTADATVDIDAERRISADPGQLLAVFENLFRNAVEHCGENVYVRVGDEDGCFYVEDDGPGIPADKRDQIFEHGYTSNENGTGFGLSILNRVAKAHGWAVEVTEGSEGGARFQMTDVTTLPEA